MQFDLQAWLASWKEAAEAVVGEVVVGNRLYHYRFRNSAWESSGSGTEVRFFRGLMLRYYDRAVSANSDTDSAGIEVKMGFASPQWASGEESTPVIATGEYLERYNLQAMSEDGIIPCKAQLDVTPEPDMSELFRAVYRRLAQELVPAFPTELLAPQSRCDVWYQMSSSQR